MDERLAKGYDKLDPLLGEVVDLLSIFETIYDKTMHADVSVFPLPQIKAQYLRDHLEDHRAFVMSKREYRALDYAMMELDAKIQVLKGFYEHFHATARIESGFAPV